ncbi:MAG: ABC transporter substrate-binding protein [Lachnospiraceae bacterium]
MKRKVLSIMLTAFLATALLAGCGSGTVSTEESSSEAETTVESESVAVEESESVSETESGAAETAVYKVGLVQYVDDASLNQILAAIQAELDAKGAELGVEFNYTDYTYNGQADSSTLNQIAADLIADEVDVIIPIATPTAMIMQAATEDNQIPVVFSAVSNPVGSGLVSALDAPGSNITGTSDALNTKAIMDLMFAADPEIKKVGLLYDKSQDSSTTPIEEAKAYCAEMGVEVVEKTGTNNGEIALAADALVAAGVDAVFTPTDNTVMTAELGIYEKFADAKIPHYAGADSFALNGAFCGYGVNYVELGTATADLAVDILVNGADPAATPVVLLDNGIATVNTEIAEQIEIDYSMFASMAESVNEIVTAKEFQ